MSDQELLGGFVSTPTPQGCLGPAYILRKLPRTRYHLQSILRYHSLEVSFQTCARTLSSPPYTAFCTLPSYTHLNTTYSARSSLSSTVPTRTMRAATPGPAPLTCTRFTPSPSRLLTVNLSTHPFTRPFRRVSGVAPPAWTVR